MYDTRLTLAAFVILVALLVGLCAQLFIRRSDVRAVEQVLYQEAVALRWQASALASEIARRHVVGEAFDRAFFAQYMLTVPLVYSSAGAYALGRLPRETRGRLHYFHSQLSAARARLKRAERSGGFDPSPYRLLSNLVRAYYELDPWIMSLRSRLGGLIEAEPDIGLANRLISSFEDDGDEPLALAYCPADSCYPTAVDSPPG